MNITNILKCIPLLRISPTLKVFEVACVMRNIAIAEQYHEERFLAFAKNIKEGRVFVRETPVVWRCRNCGCLVTGTHAPALCPACAHPTAHFEVLHNPW